MRGGRRPPRALAVAMFGTCSCELPRRERQDSTGFDQPGFLIRDDEGRLPVPSAARGAVSCWRPGGTLTADPCTHRSGTEGEEVNALAALNYQVCRYTAPVIEEVL